MPCKDPEKLRQRRNACCRKWYSENREKALARHKRWQSENREKKAAYDKKYRAQHREKRRICNRKWFSENRAWHKQWYSENRERILARQKQSYSENREKARAYRNHWHSKNREKDRASYNKWLYRNIKFLLSKRFSERMRCSLVLPGKNGRSWQTLVDYTLEMLMDHLEKLFQSGMTWKNYGEWHIDHKEPISSFDFETYEDPEFKRCWALTNLQPLWAHDNIVKGAKILNV